MFTNTKSLIEKYRQKSGTNNLSFALNASVRKMSREEEFNMEKFEKRILQIEVRILSKFEQKIIKRLLDFVCTGRRHHWLVQRGEGGGC